MKKKYFILVLVLTVACNNNSSSDEIASHVNSSKSDAIELHDEIMADMGKLNSLKKSLQSYKKNTSNENNKDLSLAIESIEKADKSMWDWMHNFNATFIHEDDSITLLYYQSKLDEIKKVKKLFSIAFSEGKKFSN